MAQQEQRAETEASVATRPLAPSSPHMVVEGDEAERLVRRLVVAAGEGAVVVLEPLAPLPVVFPVDLRCMAQRRPAPRTPPGVKAASAPSLFPPRTRIAPNMAERAEGVQRQPLLRAALGLPLSLAAAEVDRAGPIARLPPILLEGLAAHRPRMWLVAVARLAPMGPLQQPVPMDPMGIPRRGEREAAAVAPR
jgi:hypothetical protein